MTSNVYTRAQARARYHKMDKEKLRARRKAYKQKAREKRLLELKEQSFKASQLNTVVTVTTDLETFLDLTPEQIRQQNLTFRLQQKLIQDTKTREALSEVDTLVKDLFEDINIGDLNE